MASHGQSIVLTGATLIDGTGKAPMPSATVAVEGGRIRFVAQGRPQDLGIEGEIVDLSGQYLLPGLIDMHTHSTYYYDRHDAATYTEPMMALLGARQLHNDLKSGVTTTRDAGGVNGVAFDLRRGLEQGFFQGPRLYVAGNLLVPTGGHCCHSHLRLPGLAVQMDGPWEVRKGVRKQVAAGADYIKLANAPEVDFTLEEMVAAVEEAHRLGRRVACHATTPNGCRVAIDAGVDTLEHGTFLEEAGVEQMVKKGIAMDATLHTGEITMRLLERRLQDPNTSAGQLPELRRQLETRKRQREVRLSSFRRAVEGGVKILAGTDYFLPQGDQETLADEIVALVSNGCSPMQGLLAATTVAASAMGWEEEIGSITEGKTADLLVVAGDPLENPLNLKKVVLVMRGGEILKG